MPSQLTTIQLENYYRRITNGGLSEAINVYKELKSKGYNYAGWAIGIANGGSISGVAALNFLSNSALFGVSSDSCRNLSQATIDNIRVSMAKGYLSTLLKAARVSGETSTDVSFDETRKFHALAFEENGLGISNWTLEIPMSLLKQTLGDAAVEKTVGPHAAQCPRDLLRRPQPSQHMRHERPQRAIGIKLGDRPSTRATRLMSTLRATRAVHATGTRVAAQLPAQAAGASPKYLSNVAKAPALLPQRRQCHALFGLHLSKSSGHSHTLTGGKVLHFRLETAPSYRGNSRSRKAWLL